MSIFYTDQIKIISITQDDNQVTTEIESLPISARVEEFNKIIIDDRGQETFAEMIIFLDKKYSINNTDKIIITKKASIIYNIPLKKWKIKKNSIIHNFIGHHQEIYI